MQPVAQATTGRGPPGRRSFSGGARPTALPAGDGFAARRSSIEGVRRPSQSGLARPAHLTMSGSGRGDGPATPRATATPDAPPADAAAPAASSLDVPIPDKANPTRKPRVLIAGGGIGGAREGRGRRREGVCGAGRERGERKKRAQGVGGKLLPCVPHPAAAAPNPAPTHGPADRVPVTLCPGRGRGRGSEGWAFAQSAPAFFRSQKTSPQPRRAWQRPGAKRPVYIYLSSLTPLTHTRPPSLSNLPPQASSSRSASSRRAWTSSSWSGT